MNISWEENIILVLDLNMKLGLRNACVNELEQLHNFRRILFEDSFMTYIENVQCEWKVHKSHTFSQVILVILLK